MSENGEDFLFLLPPPSAVLRDEERWPGVYRARENDYHVVDSAWAGLPDLLVDSKRRRWIGLSYYLPRRQASIARAAAIDWDPLAFRILPASSADLGRAAVNGDVLLDLIWGVASPNVEHQPAQLDISVVSWLWNEAGNAPVGVVLFDVDEVARKLALQIPQPL